MHIYIYLPTQVEISIEMTRGSSETKFCYSRARCGCPTRHPKNDQKNDIIFRWQIDHNLRLWYYLFLLINDKVHNMGQKANNVHNRQVTMGK